MGKLNWRTLKHDGFSVLYVCSYNAHRFSGLNVKAQVVVISFLNIFILCFKFFLEEKWKLDRSSHRCFYRDVYSIMLSCAFTVAA